MPDNKKFCNRSGQKEITMLALVSGLGCSETKAKQAKLVFFLIPHLSMLWFCHPDESGWSRVATCRETQDNIRKVFYFLEHYGELEEEIAILSFV
jgi:hypothetical protein